MTVGVVAGNKHFAQRIIDMFEFGDARIFANSDRAARGCTNLDVLIICATAHVKPETLMSFKIAMQASGGELYWLRWEYVSDKNRLPILIRDDSLKRID